MSNLPPDAVELNPNVYALIIGINEYVLDTYKNLKGAVADADAIEACIIQKLHAPRENIVSLRNATRQQMLDGFKKLEEITERCPGPEDPCIIVFYAGHGARASRPEGWEEWAVDTDMIEMLCPSDLGVEIPAVGEGGEVDYVEGILDRNIAATLNSLAKKRGNNITLILDCCCSAGINRDSDDPFLTARWIDSPPALSRQSKAILTTPEPEPWSDSDTKGPSLRDAKSASSFGSKFHNSHILLAACRRDRKAYERGGHGLFTRSLLKFFEDPKFKEQTYNSMMHSLQMPEWQTPHCIGANADRPLFNPHGDRSDPSYIPCTRTTIDAKGNPIPEVLTLKAGSADGIVPGERLAIYARAAFEARDGPAELQAARGVGVKDNVNNPRLGLMTAVQVNTTSSILQRLALLPSAQPGLGNGTPTAAAVPVLPRVFYARRIDWTNDPPAVYCEDAALLKAICDADTGEFVSITVVDDPSQASLILRVEEDDAGGGDATVYVERTDPSINAWIPARLGLPPPNDDFDEGEDKEGNSNVLPTQKRLRRSAPGDIQMVIGAWKHFTYHLHRRPPPSSLPLESQIRMELHHLEPIAGDRDNYRPTGRNLLEEEPAHVDVPDVPEDDDDDDDAEEEEEEEEGLLGMTLYNDSDTPVYPYLFYFDPTDLTISPWSLAPQGAGTGLTDAPLLPHAQLTLGYGNGGADAWQFYLPPLGPDGQKRERDVGFFKLFVVAGAPAPGLGAVARRRSVFGKVGLGGRGGGGGDADADGDGRGDGQEGKGDGEGEGERWGVKVATVVQHRVSRTMRAGANV